MVAEFFSLTDKNLSLTLSQVGLVWLHEAAQTASPNDPTPLAVSSLFPGQCFLTLPISLHTSQTIQAPPMPPWDTHLPEVSSHSISDYLSPLFLFPTFSSAEPQTTQFKDVWLLFICVLRA
jgi:hypothetical protein